MDSPFNRLDSNHRKNLIEHFLRNNDNQIIFLSTDEEINSVDQYNIKELINNTFFLDYDKKEKTSKICEGYFA